LKISIYISFLKTGSVLNNLPDFLWLFKNYLTMQKRKLIKFLVLMITVMFLVASCTSELIKPEPVTKPGNNVSYSADVQPIFTSNCLGCHGLGGTSPDLTAANSFNSLNSLGLINTSNPSNSTLYVEMSSGPMSSYCTPSNAATVLAWIEQGAKNN